MQKRDHDENIIFQIESDLIEKEDDFHGFHKRGVCGKRFPKKPTEIESNRHRISQIPSDYFLFVH